MQIIAWSYGVPRSRSFRRLQFGIFQDPLFVRESAVDGLDRFLDADHEIEAFRLRSSGLPERGGAALFQHFGAQFFEGIDVNLSHGLLSLFAATPLPNATLVNEGLS